ncbi:hypothetical protein [Helicobacter marmotae]|nr:hypothetical protein [Helicobacter marmotae]
MKTQYPFGAFFYATIFSLTPLLANTDIESKQLDTPPPAVKSK